MLVSLIMHLQDQVNELLARVMGLRRQHALLLSQLARAAKCLGAVDSESHLLKAEITSLQAAHQVGQDLQDF